MRSSTVLILSGLAAAAYAQTNQVGLPQCAGACVTNFGSCNQLDVECICRSENLIADLACCVSRECNAEDQQATINFANALCSGRGVDNLPQTATCASTTTSATATSTGGVARATGAGQVGLGVVLAGVAALL